MLHVVRRLAEIATTAQLTRNDLIFQGLLQHLHWRGQDKPKFQPPHFDIILQRCRGDQTLDHQGRPAADFAIPAGLHRNRCRHPWAFGRKSLLCRQAESGTAWRLPGNPCPEQITADDARIDNHLLDEFGIEVRWRNH